MCAKTESWFETPTNQTRAFVAGSATRTHSRQRDIPYVIPGRAESLDFRPCGFILTRSLQIWMMILLVVGVLVVVAVIGWRFLLTPQQRKRFFWISR
jgi:Tfp pilus assembly protein PilN